MNTVTQVVHNLPILLSFAAPTFLYPPLYFDKPYGARGKGHCIIETRRRDRRQCHLCLITTGPRQSERCEGQSSTPPKHRRAPAKRTEEQAQKRGIVAHIAKWRLK